jgi:D-serine deaminase-like pyridoxal phosphate-dependent protein
MTAFFPDLPTPAILVDRKRVERNIAEMQAAADAARIELRPHIKTHKMVEVARRQLAAGARGLTCAKLGEAEAMLPSGVRSLFVAHALVDPAQAPRVRALAERLTDFRVGLSSEAQLDPLARLAAGAGLKLVVMLAVDTGLHREGVRDPASAHRLAARLAHHRDLQLAGLYTHEGYLYGTPIDQRPAGVAELLDRLCSLRDAIDPGLAVWPGCSVSAHEILRTGTGRVQAVRPGAYVFGDLSLAETTRIMPASAVALEVLATVVDLPEPGLALIDAGSKTFSSDRTPGGVFGRATDGRDLAVTRVNEEHGYVTGSAVASLSVGERVRLMPAHVCTVVNLTDEVSVIEEETLVDTWRVDARGKTR